jgi:hypothetical protein
MSVSKIKMAISGDELARMTNEDIDRLFSPYYPRCPLCNELIDSDEPPQYLNGKEVHPDAYCVGFNIN